MPKKFLKIRLSPEGFQVPNSGFGLPGVHGSWGRGYLGLVSGGCLSVGTRALGERRVMEVGRPRLSEPRVLPR